MLVRLCVVPCCGGITGSVLKPNANLMKELFEAAFSGVNIIPTILLLLILIYWIFVILGALDMDFLDVEVDSGEVDLDMDIDADVDTGIDTDLDTDTDLGSVAFMNSILTFFNLGRIPFMVWLSFLFIPMWCISILTNHFLMNGSFLLSLVFLIPNIIVSLMVSKVLTTPVAAMFSKLKNNAEDSFKYAGKVCTTLMKADHKKYGQAEIQHEGNTYRITILTKEEGVLLQKGDTGLVIDFLEDKKCYIVEPYKI